MKSYIVTYFGLKRNLCCPFKISVFFFFLTLCVFGSCFRILVATCVSNLKIKILNENKKIKKSKRVLDSEQRKEGGGGWVICASCGTRQRD